MISLALLARDPNDRQGVCAHIEGGNPAPNLGVCQLVGFNGRRKSSFWP